MTYHPSLDGIRGIAVILVVFLHVQVFIYHDTPVFGWLNCSGGFLGVDIFFVLSGFLITGLLMHEHQQTGSISLKHFYLRRALRLIPALLLLLLVTGLYAAVFLSSEITRQTITVSLFAICYLTNWAFAFQWVPGSDLLGHLWSLSVEEQFYLLWPVCLIALFSLRVPRRMMIILTIAAIVFLCLHRIDLLSQGARLSRVYPASDTRADSILVGCLTALFYRSALPAHRSFNTLLNLLTLAALVTMSIYVADVFEARSLTLYSFGFTLFALSVGVIILKIMHAETSLFRAVLENRLLVWAGKVSYGIYLWHFLAIRISAGLAVSNVLKALIAVALLVGIAATSFYIVEKPFLRLKDRLARRSQLIGDVPQIQRTIPGKVIT